MSRRGRFDRVVCIDEGRHLPRDQSRNIIGHFFDCLFYGVVKAFGQRIAMAFNDDALET